MAMAMAMAHRLPDHSSKPVFVHHTPSVTHRRGGAAITGSRVVRRSRRHTRHRHDEGWRWPAVWGSCCSGWRGTDLMSVLLSPNPENGTELSRADNDVDVSATLGIFPAKSLYSRIQRSTDLETESYSPAPV
jgi:hypothetical protein